MPEPYLIDTHCHVSFEAYKQDVDDVVQRALDKNIWIVAVATQHTTATEAMRLAEKYDGVFFTAGVHPIQSYPGEIKEDTPETKIDFKARGEVFEEGAYEKLIKHPKCVAVGEIGLDYYHIPKDSERHINHQKQELSKQLGFAAKHNKPVYLHCREAYDDLLAEIRTAKEQHPNLTGVAHFFAGTKEQAKQFLELGFFISFTGVITFTHDYDEVVRSVPLDRILTETDAPYVTPAPHRGKRNEPAYVEYVAAALAKIYNTTKRGITQITTANAQSLLGI